MAQLRGSSDADITQMLCMGDHLLALGGGLQVWAAGEWEDGPQVHPPSSLPAGI